MTEPMEDDDTILAEYGRKQFLINKRIEMLTRHLRELEFTLTTLKELINDAHMELLDLNRKREQLRKK